MKVIVFGATGKTGVAICKELESRKIEHSAFVREGSEPKIQTKQTKIVQGDVLSKEDISKAMTKAAYTNIIISLGSRDLKANKVRSEGTKNIVDVLKENNLSAKLQIVSAHGVDESWADLNWFEKLFSNLLLKKVLEDHKVQEYVAKTNPGGFHIVRPVGLTDGPQTGKIQQKQGEKMPSSKISRANVAQYLVESAVAGESGIFSISNA